MSKKTTFNIGISMAGAISAGAYTAGVMDYLIEALDNWQLAKELQEKGLMDKKIPKHNVSIDVLSGASAGGMTAVLTSAAIQTKFDPVYKSDILKDTEKLKANPLYHSWVDLTQDDMMRSMLSNSDMLDNEEHNPHKEVRSLFNSDFIKEIAQRHIKNVEKDEKLKRPYFADDLEIITTLTNLRGIPFEVDFNNASYTRKHRMTRHFDLGHFRLESNNPNKDDGRIPVSYRGLGKNINIMVQAAMATGGFPIGLEPRILKREGKYILKNKYLNLGEQSSLHTINSKDEYETLNVDGGTINNDPFDLTHKIIQERENLKECKKSAEEFNSAVVMIDPFPNHSATPSTNYKSLKAFKFIIPQIISAMLGELRMKENVLKQAYGDQDYTKYLILPSRSNANPKKENYIACASLGGFGGFFSKDFRKHDFILGRRNCQRFLQSYFSVPKEKAMLNERLKFGYGDFAEQYETDVNGKLYVPIIPDIRVKKIEGTEKYTLKDPDEFIEEGMDFPSIKLSSIISLHKPLTNRVLLILKNILNGKKDNEDNNKNKCVSEIRKKKLYGRITNSIKKGFTNGVLFLAKKPVAKRVATSFENFVIEDMDYNELLVDDINKKHQRKNN